MLASSLKRTMTAVFVSAALAGCNDGSSNDGSSSVEIVDKKNTAIMANRQFLGESVNIIDDHFSTQDLQLSIREKGVEVPKPKSNEFLLSHGLVVSDLANRAVYYIPTRAGANRSFEYIVSDGVSRTSGAITVTGVLESDPLAAEQWHLNNTGQTGYAMNEQTYQALVDLRVAQGMSEEAAKLQHQRDESILVPGEDMNVLGAYKHGITGEGTITVVVDSGMAIYHEDLVDNVLPNRSINFVDGSSDPTLTGTGGDHGTSVAGLIAATGWNGLGGRGVASDAGLIGLNYLESQDQQSLFASYGLEGSGINPSENLVAFNRSYGISAPIFVATTDVDEVLFQYPTENLRRGLGALNIKSAGNSFISSRSWQEGNTLCDLAQAGINPSQSRVFSCYDSNWDPANASFYTLTIGAVNTDGHRSSYSTAGSSLWVSAPAGEDGTENPAMVTTDQMSCERGYASQAAVDQFEATTGIFLAMLGVEDFYQRVWPFNTPGTDLNQDANPNCNYTNTFNGTSSAAPNVTGVTALIAEANPNLSWREIRYILAKTADKVDPNDEPVTLLVGSHLTNNIESQNSIDKQSNGVTTHLGWVENAAGYSFNNKYGFGRVNAGKAVALALQGLTLPPLIKTDWIDITPTNSPVVIPDADAQGAAFSFKLGHEIDSNLTLEGMQFGFNIENSDLFKVGSGDLTGSTAASDLAIKVISPEGTEAVLATSRTSLGVYQGLGNDSAPGYAYHVSGPMLVNAFLGEKVQGEWTVNIVDTNRADFGEILNNQVESQLTKAQVRVYGH
ncbi:S8 family serine peptidase [Salinivibrio sp. ES.052]|uniref:S8 family peptidase n=1 Tax=Salinivibrio sp. ES.052 TaxID=1882823 RepID=UPI0009275D91|nr:S8 family serine peptidase [Salinivibrio sp. ES.052]SIN79042.1 Proprotein convertase P-domain-containing protein [Salinivibrio sp. ES.052]